MAALPGPAPDPRPGQEGPVLEPLRESQYRSHHPAGRPVLGRRADARPESAPGQPGRPAQPVQAAVLPGSFPAGLFRLLARCGAGEARETVDSAARLRRRIRHRPGRHHLRAGRHLAAVPGQPAQLPVRLADVPGDDGLVQGPLRQDGPLRRLYDAQQLRHLHRPLPGRGHIATQGIKKHSISSLEVTGPFGSFVLNGPSTSSSK